MSMAVLFTNIEDELLCFLYFLFFNFVTIGFVLIWRE